MELTDKMQNVVEEAIKEACTMMSITPTLSDKILLDSVAEGVNSIIMVKGDIIGKINLFVDNNSACQMVSKMLYSEIEDVNDEVIDGIGEVLNVIIGGIKTKCFADGHNFEISVPSTTIVSSAKNSSIDGYGIVEQSFECEENIKFSVKFAYRHKTPSEKPKEEEKPKMSAADLLNSLIQKQQEK